MNFKDQSFLRQDEIEIPYKTVWEYADFRLKSLLQSKTVRRELLIVGAMVFLLFAGPLVSWWKRWMLPGSLQGYAIWALPLVGGWLWVNRRKIILPELDSLNEQFTERSVLRYFVEEEPEKPKRILWVLIVGAILTPLALRFGEPAFTCIAFITLLTGIIGYRLGTHALRVLAFPLAFMTTMIPLPGIATDSIQLRVQTLLFKVARNLLQIVGLNAELPADNNPLIVFGTPRFEMYAGQAGSGVAETGMFLILLLVWLSLIATPFRFKIVSFVCGMLWITFVATMRFVALVYATRGLDPDYTALLIPTSLWMIPIVGFAGQFLIMKGLKCKQMHEWVAVS